MAWNCTLSSGYEQIIYLCNHHTVHACTGFHVTIMHTTEKGRREHLIEWMEKFENFSGMVRRFLIDLHKGYTPSFKQTERIVSTYDEFMSSMSQDLEEKYLRQFESGIKEIFTIYKKAMASNM